MAKVTNTLRKKPNISAAILFAGFAMLFLSPALIPGNDKVLGGYDMRGLFHVLATAFSDAVHDGRLPLWNPYLFNGFPLMADPQMGVFYPVNWLSIIFPVNIGLSLYLLFHIWLAGFGMYAFVRYTGGRWLPSFLAGVVFAFGGILGGRLWAGHSIVYAVFSWTPWLLLALSWSVTGGTIWSAIVAGVPLGLAILAGHLPSVIYIMLIWGAFLLFLLITESNRRLKVGRQALLMLLAGIGLAAIQIIPTLQLSLLSERVSGGDYQFATRFSFPPAHLVTFLAPEYFGEPLHMGYWSVPTFEELTYYAGIVSFLVLLIAIRKPDKMTWFYIALMVLGLSVALGSYGVVHRVLYQVLPPFRVMRAPARAGILIYFGLAGLVGYSLSRWMDFSLEQRRKIFASTWKWVMVILVISGVAAAAAIGATFMSQHPTDTSGRLWHQLGGLSTAVILILIGGGLLGVYLFRVSGNALIPQAAMVALIGLAIVDLWTFSYKYVRTENVGPDELWVDAKEIIGETNAGVLPWGLSVFTQNGGMQVNLRSVFGYNSLAPGAHLVLASSVPDPRSSAYDILAVDYVISEAALDQFSGGESGLAVIDRSTKVNVYQRPNSLPLARVVYQVEVIADSNEAINRIHDPAFDAASVAIIGKQPECARGGSVPLTDAVEIVDSSPGYWKLATSTDQDALVILAENAYPGWEVFVDGEESQGYTAYTSLKAVCVPSGDHVVEWVYFPRIIILGLAVTTLSLVIVLISLFMIQRRKTGEGVDLADQ